MFTLTIPGRLTQDVPDLASASAAYAQARDLSGEGASTFPTGEVREGKRSVGHVSYNAKVWPRVNWQVGDTPLFNPYSAPPPHYNPEAVDVAIEQANRRSKVSGRERKMIHAILKGRG